MPTISYLLDENMPHAVRDQLLLREPTIDVQCVGDRGGPTLGTADPKILEWIEQERRVLVSRNRRTIPDHLAAHLANGRHVPGILLVRGRSSWGQILDDLLFIWHNCQDDELQDQIIYLPL